MNEMVLIEDDAPPDCGRWEVRGPYNEALKIRLINDSRVFASPQIKIERVGAAFFRVYVDDVLVYTYDHSKQS